MSHIVIDARELKTSSGRYVERLVHYLQTIDEKNTYTILLKPADFIEWEPTNPNFKKMPCNHKEFTFDEQLGFLGQLNALKADLVHFAFPQQPILYKGTTVTTIHDLTTLRFSNPDKKRTVFWIKQRVYGYVVKRACAHAAAVLAPSEFTKADLLQYARIPADKVTVTLEAADPILASPAPLADLQNKQFIMYVGRPTPHKNLERLIEAFKLLQTQHPSLHLVLSGKKDANYERIEQAARAEGVKNLYFTGFISEGELRWLYEHCAAYVFPSLAEGFGLPGLEAMVHGAPVVSSNATCLPEIYGEAAHYFDPKNLQAMADAINEVLIDKNLRQRLIAAGHERAAQFSWQRMAEQTLQVYEQALRTKR